MSNPWDRQACDDDESWPQFQKYRDQAPPRRVVRFGVGADPAALNRWATANAWRDRAAAFDSHLDEIKQAEIADTVRQSAREVAAQHMAILKDARELVGREIAKWLRASEEGDMHGLLKPGELARLMDVTVKYDRLVRGETTENVATSNVDLSALSDEELAVLEKLSERAKSNEPSDQH